MVIVVLVVAYFLWGQNQSASPGTEQSQTTNPTPTPTSSGSAGAVRVRVLAPNGGETWLRGKQYNVRWDTAGLAPDSMVYVDLILTASVITNPYVNSKRITGQEMFNAAIFPDATPPEGTYSYKVPQTIKPGTYQVLIFAGKDCNTPEPGERCKYDLSDGLITVK
ncbi:hypothetical protein A3H65_03545 [Candidatus Giovannonibacteria bacterium RIFCSPLOWO2_02_FULL_45_14]|uniref:YtkA-like domain-containing protein n=1 Tax=Candidatus Giovannonibacteria bacterium RIFCSPLOWO2_12_FULL_44_15 TaxID=1798364 RepID=A0A1F5XZI3_9BACT|nr:MAG: hypothetical protein A3C75_00585 [Candidatus Giovannonibacteria bacterium RIFCSPHIGHO2_02_FULL_44_31]OGF76789.1 MAG: hypothetical protein A3E62_01065 [Candidatus Giovannonibacteria bacterium RIFCSPHIGHO2_12_FULL_44_29]OGF90899.1 MAG: hypothetical protein A3H65_03545 [Candidatus Giovannonibacteria bacterium RIFCSPLOWO2_02_FULL_45_14]OGF92961.1 MAG: hypothetical protein A3G54_01780 [Candidatus Giovannonibacteria bacterium RIFCSPLOWO2_12_FULL_44_15]